MTKQDWRNDKDYAYTKNLDNKGWAWEFIRRRDDYLKAYAECQRYIERVHKGDWSKEQPLITPFDTAGLSPAMIRLKSNSAKLQRRLTHTQQTAAQWGLWAMYDPTMSYDPLRMKFDLTNPFPAFYADRLDQEVDGRESREGIQPYSELFKPKPLMKDADIVVVAFDTRRPLAAQLAKAKKTLTGYQDKKRKLVQVGKPQKAGLSLYIRMLDAVETSGSTLTPGKIVQILDPHKKFKGAGGYDMVEYKQINKYGEDTLESARAFRDEGYLNLLFKIRNTD